MKKLKLFFLFLLLPFVAKAYDAYIGGIYYDLNTVAKTATVTYRSFYSDGYLSEYSGVVNIPETITYNGSTYSVTSISDGAFYGCSGLTSVTIPNSVTTIGYAAFYRCSGLKSINIPNSVTSIGGSAFYGTAWYNNQSDGLVYAGKVAYKYKGTMPSGTSITLEEGTLGITARAFDGCSGLTSVTIPNSVTSIGDYAFKGCSGLTSLTIPNSITSIEISAFEGCSSLTSLTIPNSITSIGISAFEDCSGLTSLTIPNSVTSIGTSAFSGCSGLTSVTILCPKVGSWFYGNTSIKEVVLGESVTSIGERAFDGCSGLTSVTIPNSVTSIGSYAFQNCTGLTSVTIPNSVTSIGGYAFTNCTGLTVVQISDIKAWCKIQFENLFSNPLYYAHHLYLDGKEITEINIPNSVTSIGSYAFQNCTGLTSVTISNSVTSIGWSAFANCTGLTAVHISDIAAWCKIQFDDRDDSNPLYYAHHLFMDDKEITELIIPNSITCIGDNAFHGCSGLTSLTIPNSVTSIGDYSFGGCSGLTSLTIPNSVTSIGSAAFEYCSGLTSLTIPNSVTSIEKNTFFMCSGLTALTIPNSITSIGSAAFGGCTNLTSIIVESDNTIYDSRNNCNAIIKTSSNMLILGCQTTVIPCGVSSIGDDAFNGCMGLTSISIPNSVTSIGDGAFTYCRNLISIISEITEPFPLNMIEVWGEYGDVIQYYSASFSGISEHCTLTIPKGLRETYIRAGWTEDVFKGGIVEVEPVNPDPQHKKGDANLDGKVNGTDIVVIANMVLGRKDKNAAADANEDGKVNGTDIVVVANIVLGHTTDAPVRKAPAVTASGSATLSIEPFNISAGQEATMTIDLNNPDDELTLVQFDLTLPKGVSIKTMGGDLDIDMAGRTNWRKHTLDANWNYGYYTFLLKSDSNTPISGTGGGIITVTLVADATFTGGKIVIDNTVLTTPDEVEINPARYEYDLSIPTALSALATDNKQLLQIYNLQGQQLSVPQKGINIINGKKVYIK